MSTKRVRATNVSGMFEARDAGASDYKGPDGDVPERVRARVLGCLEGVAEKGRGGQLDFVEARHRGV